MNGDATAPINLGSPHEFTIRQLAEQVRARINPELLLIEKPLPSDDLDSVSPTLLWLSGCFLGTPRRTWSNPPSSGFRSCWAEAARLNGRLAPLYQEGCESAAEPARHG